MNNKEYKIQINLTPHYWDNKNAPFFWCILYFSDKWCNIGSGWSTSVDDAYIEAIKYFHTHFN